ncbi:hypothetical protein C8R46DRAFT_1313521 [Mycena filopes]|nr:hypothetical protein C8R46DRAFT_1313521 [Mycena filopes]
MDTDDTLATRWVAAEWIGQGKKYKNIPTYVEAARRRILQLPTSTESHFPSKTLPISQLLLFNLPPIARNENWDHSYSPAEPARNIEESLAFLAVPSRPALQRMVNDFGQAWFDGNKSIRTSLRRLYAAGSDSDRSKTARKNAGCSSDCPEDDIDFGLLSQYPTDLELSAAYEIAAEENNCLWSLLGIHPMDIANAPDPGQSLIAQPAPDPDFKDLYLHEDDETVEEEERSAAEELQKVVDSLKNVSNITRAGDEELDACVMASVALAMEELAKIDDLPETDPERFAEIQAEIVHAMSTQPTAFVALLQGIAASAHTNSTASDQALPPTSRPLVDVSSSDLAPLVALCREHQTREERMGVRTYKGSGTCKNPKTGVEKPLTERQILAQKMQGIIRKDQERGSSSGLNRTVRWTGTGSSAEASKAGNAANAELAARGRAKDAMKRRRTIFGKLKCLSTVAEAGIGANCPLAAGLYGFVMLGSEVVLARVITMYSKNGGKAGAHAWVPTCDTIGSLSYLVVQLYQHSYRQIGVRAQKIFEELRMEKEMLGKAVASLNTVQRKGKAMANILEIEEDDAEAEE